MVAVKPFGPVHAIDTPLVMVRSTAPLASPQVVGVTATSWMTGIEPTTTLCAPPAAMRLQPGTVTGTVPCPLSLRPQETTCPLLRSATVWLKPAAIAVQVPRLTGTLHWP